MIEKQLIERIAKGEQEAQMLFYRMHVNMLFVSANRIINNAQIAEDIVHDTFIRAFEHIKEVKNPSALAGWLRTIARNKALDQLKLELRFDTNEPTDAEIELESAEIADIGLADIHSALNQLPCGYRAILNLHLLEDMSFEEIAKVLDIKPSTVRSQFARGRIKLVQLLNRYHVRQA